MIDPSWKEFLDPEFEKPYMGKLRTFLKEQMQLEKIYPPSGLVFNALIQTPLDSVKVVIIGQDPYHGPGQAHGLSFSVPKGVPLPPSLRNIFKELQDDLLIPLPSHGCLESWAKQGVLLLNATLTVVEGKPQSHHLQGWEMFTDRIVEILFQKRSPVVFLLWGKSALQKIQHIDLSQKHPHLILTAPHPSPLSAYTGFLGCKHFSKTNDFLKTNNLNPIDWEIH